MVPVPRVRLPRRVLRLLPRAKRLEVGADVSAALARAAARRQDVESNQAQVDHVALELLLVVDALHLRASDAGLGARRRAWRLWTINYVNTHTHSSK